MWRALLIATLVTVNILTCCSAPYHVQIGLNLGTSYADDVQQTCLSPEKQILRNFYVDYFHSPSSCKAPDGTTVHVFKSKGHDSAPYGGSHSSMCARLPGICQMMQQHSCGDYSVPVCEGIEDVAFPVMGWSAINNHSVVILQEFPVLLQPVFFRKCKSSQSQVVHGRCVQEYLPIKFFVKPTYPGGSISQDFVMVESGCQVAVDFHHRQWKDLPAPDDSKPKIERKDVVEMSRQSDRQLF
ncbi:uncharacterized protein [Penaeus vannamei]|uniref:uncharacterized protein n=1 Tax=Penaeus vannamei TaxID=6689 RepID=UPI00387F4BD4